MWLCCQNMKAQWAVRETAQMMRVRQVTLRTAGLNRSARPGGVAFSRAWTQFRFGHRFADPEGEQGGEHADDEDPARALFGEQPTGEAGEEHADVDRCLEGGGDPGAPRFRPGFGQQGRAHGPLAADAEGGKKPEDQQVPPLGGKRGEPGEPGIGQDREDQGPAAPDAVADAPEKRATDGPADEERGLNDRGLFLGQARVRLGRLSQQQRHERHFCAYSGCLGG
jgi:hypothetical protein